MNKFKQITTYLAFNLAKIIDMTFISIFVLVVAVNLIYDRIPTYLGYLFWFIFGAFICRILNYYAYNFLRRSYYENDEYLQKLNEKEEERRKNKK